MAKTVNLRSDAEIALVRESSLLVGRTLAEVARNIGPGTRTGDLDRMAETFIRDHGAVPGFKGLYGCPSTLLISVNQEVVHGLPGDRVLREGDIASVDCGVLMNGFYGDSAYTFAIGEVDPAVMRLLRVTRECLELGIGQAVDGRRTGDLGHAVQRHAETNGYGVVRELVGHGVGRELHEDPQIPNYGKAGRGPRLEPGMTLAIEPMINMGSPHIEVTPDQWTYVTKDRRLSAHFEHTVAITDKGNSILTI